MSWRFFRRQTSPRRSRRRGEFGGISNIRCNGPRTSTTANTATPKAIAAGNTGCADRTGRAGSIDRIEWARDRQGKYGIVPIGYRIEVGPKEGEWDDRQFGGSSTVQERQPAKPVYAFDNLPKAKAERGSSCWRNCNRPNSNSRFCRTAPMRAGTFAQPGPTRLFYRGDPESPRDAITPGALAKFVAEDGREDLRAKTPARLGRLDRKRHPACAARDRQPHLAASLRRAGRYAKRFRPQRRGSDASPTARLARVHLCVRRLVTQETAPPHTSRKPGNSSCPHAKAFKIDAASRLLWRFPTRRLEAEAIRDSMLHASGVLDLKWAARASAVLRCRWKMSDTFS